MLYSIENFSNSITQNHELSSVIRILHSNSIIPTLVGGAVRDYFITGEFGIDFDFEIQYKASDLTIQELVSLVYNALTTLGDSFSVTKLRFNILKVVTHNINCEFSFPRTELYSHEKDLYKHDEFICTYHSFLPFEESFKRRDLTINAIGIQIRKNCFDIVDPFGGLKDLQEASLRNCDVDFFNDPVRFLRLIRFKIKLNFAISPSLRDQLHNFNLNQLSFYYFFTEAFKSEEPIEFLNLFFNYCYRYKISISDDLALVKGWKDLEVDNIKNYQEMFFAALFTLSYSKKEYFAIGEKLQIKKRWISTGLAIKESPKLLSDKSFIHKNSRLLNQISDVLKFYSNNIISS